MSTIYSAMNTIVIAGVCIAAYFVFSQPKHYETPDSPWFKSAVIDQKIPVVVKFGATWCPPCRYMEGELDKLAGSMAGRVAIVRIDVDQQPQLAQHFGVSGIPHTYLFNHGKVVAEKVGGMSAEQLQSWIAAKAGK